tara:strand:- start:183 stop:665 length:483 start_codon:yes stop_codon:yes gene_type:complete
MDKYQRGKIYKIIDNTNGDIYIGSTIQSLANRKSQHKVDTAKGTNKCVSKSIINNGNYDFILIENYPCESRGELLKRERYYIDNTECINYVRCYISTDERKEYEIKYALENKDIINERVKKYYQEHKEEKAEYDKKYRAKNKDKRRDYDKKRRQLKKNNK